MMTPIDLSKLMKKTRVEKKIEKSKKIINRFDGLTEEEVQKNCTLEDYLQMNLDIVFIGINPSLTAAHRGKYYAGACNHFYKLLHKSGLTPYLLKYEEDHKLLEYGIGLTNVVHRPTRSSADLKSAELKEGMKCVEEKLMYWKPKIAVFNGKCIYDACSTKSGAFKFGLQRECIGESAVWVVPSSSARCANFPRLEDKLHFFTSLKKYLQFLKGEIECVDMKDFQFEGKCTQFIPRTSKMWRRKDASVFLNGGRVANKQLMCLDTSDVATAYSSEFIVKKVRKNESNEEAKKSKSSKNSKSNSESDIEIVFENVQ
ncbi:G/T mismatch-specific thymine DNA glycosylase-like isoform X2 [Ceratina calcarata]|nr:G/T mismatch-specific thymine DNA glycosylase-like isoform X2 [Ceratina calcarata]XP_017882297.1 G/T mismatch-specific thymine DNA glycosylase-like isoform X2 [Ceratina calcarata]